MKTIKLIFISVLLTVSAFSQSGSSGKTPQKGSNATPITKQFIGVYYIELKFKEGSGFFSDSKTTPYFQDYKNCKKYLLDLKSLSCSLSNEPTPCRIVGHFKNNTIVCDSIITTLTQSVKDSILIIYTNNCKVKK